ncbi:tRNA-specific adenosine deaminase 2 [Fistulifera solaris]|uniref:tRNA-specific adenosine deaminase 2 n=1 Tax=Fistulifera solaris TaxID=1519565 RepID=A0A1Z5KEN6_FISSO|nr:tRNA-specific adenosine deaminase 2 [Fistulifera solaris]|eukprot:GAX24541.1 tRNA-specific adenosine deaminase 2 [Fistulifera solaris]
MTTPTSSGDDTTRNNDEYYMRLALQVAQEALLFGEVPVGCILVQSDGTIVSHGANQVNATRDATRHAELVAIDRWWTGGVFSDQLRMSPEEYAQVAKINNLQEPALEKYFYNDDTIQSSDGRLLPSWGLQKQHPPADLSLCHLYVTCEPCIMCAAALAKMKIGCVIFGCRNDKFGGCGSILHVHQEDAGYRIVSGVLEDEAIALLRSFYSQENHQAPDEKRKRKDNRLADNVS